jgi:F0F1-type ATP synthase membrane subunit b/b'
MYYCFECNCECICPECVIHGKHKNHDVKTLRKSQPVIKGRLENLLENIDNNIDGLTLKKSEFEKHIKDVSEFNNNSKKQIQRVFNDLRQRIANKENEILAKCDKALEMTVEEFEAGIKAIVRKIDDIKQSSQSIVDVLKRDEVLIRIITAYVIELLCS